MPRRFLVSDRREPVTMTAEEAAAFAAEVFERARQGDAAMLARLLDSGVPANLRNHKGDTLLMLASYHGHLDAARVLLEHGADPAIANDNQQMPLAGAAFKGDLPMVRLLLEGGGDPDASAGDGRTALMMAAMFNRVAIVDYLLEQGADPHRRDVRGADALASAQAMGAADTAARLRALAG
ncbi:ankyrin repeat domain-containing protein [Pseudomonas sp. zfem002]|uniref:ankyrin repeat domain-containing protein n=1 Tax=Pseudomonas sp. zfem002 TaxID=3078197 RepID=UPI0039772BD3